MANVASGGPWQLIPGKTLPLMVLCKQGTAVNVLEMSLRFYTLEQWTEFGQFWKYPKAFLLVSHTEVLGFFLAVVMSYQSHCPRLQYSLLFLATMHILQTLHSASYSRFSLEIHPKETSLMPHPECYSVMRFPWEKSTRAVVLTLPKAAIL